MNNASLQSRRDAVTATLEATNSNPFDFSDFGTQPSPDAGRVGVRPASDATSGGFDPFAGRPLTSGPSTAPAEVFTGSSGAAPGALAVAGPPLLLLGAAFTTAAVGVGMCGLSLFAASDASAALLAFVGWLLAGPAAIGALSWFSGVDTRRKLHSVYSAPTWLSHIYWMVLTVCAVGIGVGAWQLALWAGRF